MICLTINNSHSKFHIKFSKIVILLPSACYLEKYIRQIRKRSYRIMIIQISSICIDER